METKGLPQCPWCYDSLMSEGATVAGFVLAGGASRRMGRDKALLTYRGQTLVERVAVEIGKVAGLAAILGDPAKYGHLGFPVVPDLIPAQGPMSGLHAALHSTQADWILLVACDLPNVDAAFLRTLVDLATVTNAKCVAAQSESGLEPLCAVYHRSTRMEVDQALHDGRLRMRDLAARLGVTPVEAGASLVRNVNTIDDWRLHLDEKKPLSYE
jgi:molybdopterin-guanine dinucleotide biosynthesis protein A